MNDDIEALKFEKYYLGYWDTTYSKAFDALLAYERNCIAKYDYPDNRPSKPIPKGERMEDFALRFDTTVKEMKTQRCEVEKYLGLGRELQKIDKHFEKVSVEDLNSFFKDQGVSTKDLSSKHQKLVNDEFWELI